MAETSAFALLRRGQGQRLLSLIGAYDEARALATTERLRRDGFDPGLVAAALTQARLRSRARTKFGPCAEAMFFTADGLEQATRPGVASRHAQRYAAAGCTVVADLCCGIGSDLIAFASAGLRATGVDHDLLTCAVARANVAVLGLAERAHVNFAEVTSGIDLGEADAVFIDPGRRASGARMFDPRSYSPPYDVVLELASRVEATGAKLAPGIPHAVLPEHAEAEWVSAGGDVVECALWFGPLSTGVRRRATLLPSAATLTGDGTAWGEVGPVRQYLYEPDGAVIRAGLVAEAAQLVAGNLIDASIAYLTSEELHSTPFCVPYRITDVVPFQLKRLRSLLHGRGVGRLTIKKRGSAIEPEALRRQLRLAGDAEATIVLTRVRDEPHVLVVEPLACATSSSQINTRTM